MDQAVLADVEIAGAGAASPLVLFSVGDVVLERIKHSVTAAAQLLGFEINGALLCGERLKLTTAIVDDPHCRGEAELDGTTACGQGVLRIADAASHYGVDVHVKLGVFGEQLQFLVENFQALLGD